MIARVSTVGLNTFDRAVLSYALFGKRRLANPLPGEKQPILDRLPYFSGAALKAAVAKGDVSLAHREVVHQCGWLKAYCILQAQAPKYTWQLQLCKG
jgi:hypothetical protein